jgi:serine/threonine protein phosphatase PrpC
MTCFFDSVVNKRNANEDSYCKMELALNHEARVCSLVVADGMGGLAAGKDYSSAAVKLWYRDLVRTLLSDEFSMNSLENQLELLKEHTVRTYARIGRTLYKKGLDSGMRGGTTLTTVIHFWNSFLIANCGDSPVYGIRDGQVELLSEIQNLAGQMVREGKTRPGSLLYYQNKNRLMAYVGGREEVHPYMRVVDSRDYDGIILGSDGAFGSLDQEEIEWILGEAAEPGDMIRTLFDAARAKGEEDNQTAILYYPRGIADQYYSQAGYHGDEERLSSDFGEDDSRESDVRHSHDKMVRNTSFFETGRQEGLPHDGREDEDYGEADWELVPIRRKRIRLPDVRGLARRLVIRIRRK